jgi:tRNA (cmo5U34)-methyltransferase
MNNFDSVAGFYDKLSTLVFGKAMRRAQTAYLHDIPPGSNVLILGGGTGWLLSELSAVNPTCKVWYIDASSKMISLSKEHMLNSTHEIVFIHGTEESIPVGIMFDAVITHFYLDLFPTDSCIVIIRKIRSAIRTSGLWLVSDFINTTLWHGVMLRMMYGFFKVMCGIEGSSLSPWKNLLEKNGFKEHKSRVFFGGFIKSAVFRWIC